MIIELSSQLVDKISNWQSTKERLQKDGFGTQSHITCHLQDAVNILNMVANEIKSYQSAENERRENHISDLIDGIQV
jgi:hypothetical protein